MKDVNTEHARTHTQGWWDTLSNVGAGVVPGLKPQPWGSGGLVLHFRSPSNPMSSTVRTRGRWCNPRCFEEIQRDNKVLMTLLHLVSAF